MFEFVVVVGLAAGPLLMGQPESAPKETKALSAQEQFEAWSREYAAQSREFQRKMQQLFQEQQRLYASDPSLVYARKMLALAKEHPKSETAVKALAWIAQHGRFNSPERNQAVALLMKDYIESEHLAPALQPLMSAPNAATALRDVMAKNPHREVKGLATFYLAQLQSRPGRSGDLTKEQEEEVIKLLEGVQKEFGDVPYLRSTLGKEAASFLAGIRNAANLKVGKVAPEISGEDVDGAPFKLSDYRGKVVLLDFWGHW